MGNCDGRDKEEEQQLPNIIKSEQPKPEQEIPSVQPEPEQVIHSVRPKPTPIILQFDKNHPMAASYEQKFSGKGVQKLVYNWHSLPLTSVIDLSTPSYFKCKNCGIEKDNFVVGIIKKDAFQSMIKTPWKTRAVICFESHQKEGDSGIIFNNEINLCGRGLKLGEILTMVVNKQTIEFKIKDEVLGKAQIPTDFLEAQILPYVALFSKADRIQIWREIQDKQKNENVNK